MTWRVPLFQLELECEEKQAVSRVLDSQWLTMGEVTERFESRFAEFIGVKHAIAVSNCTAAMHLAYCALGLEKGDEVICPSLTFVATVSSVIMSGATPVLADINSLDDWTISPDSIMNSVSRKTKAINVMHYGGYPCQMQKICDVAEKHGLYVIEDCAHSPGASIEKILTGAWGHIGCFSFFSNKNMTTGEGGMITTNDDELASKLRLMRSHGMTTQTIHRYKGHAFSYDVVNLGYNYRMTEMNAALGEVQLKKLRENNRKRYQIVQEYKHQLEDIGELQIPFNNNAGQPANHLFPILLPEKVDRAHFMAYLRNAGVQSSIHYIPVHQFTLFRERDCRLPLTENVGRRVVTLPLYPGLQTSAVHYIANLIKSYLANRKK